MHYKMVQAYINNHSRFFGGQQKSTATGGTRLHKILYELETRLQTLYEYLTKLDDFDDQLLSDTQLQEKIKSKYLEGLLHISDAIQKQSRRNFETKNRMISVFN